MNLQQLQGKCGVCLHELAGGPLARCATCGSSYPAECFKFNREKCAVYGCWKSPFPKRRLGPPQRHADIFNPFVMGALILALLAVMAWNWHTFHNL